MYSIYILIFILEENKTFHVYKWYASVVKVLKQSVFSCLLEEKWLRNILFMA